MLVLITNISRLHSRQCVVRKTVGVRIDDKDGNKGNMYKVC